MTFPSSGIPKQMGEKFKIEGDCALVKIPPEKGSQSISSSSAGGHGVSPGQKCKTAVVPGPSTVEQPGFLLGGAKKNKSRKGARQQKMTIEEVEDLQVLVPDHCEAFDDVLTPWDSVVQHVVQTQLPDVFVNMPVDVEKQCPIQSALASAKEIFRIRLCEKIVDCVTEELLDGNLTADSVSWAYLKTSVCQRCREELRGEDIAEVAQEFWSQSDSFRRRSAHGKCCRKV